ncbi:MAG TPA: hypothetical protein DDZ55_10095 [Firmicutes bacterium]|nr:hypothetical protein [Bacillota bacterium]
MKTTKILGLLLVIVVLGASGLALAADTVTQTVTIQVDPVNDISVSGDPAPLIVTAGGAPATDSSTSYDLTTNGVALKITGEIDTDVPADTTLTVDLTAPTGATSLGPTLLSTTPADLVTGIGTVAETALGITYEFSALVTAGAVGTETRTVTFTITN